MAKTTRERDDDARQERLERMREQIEAGELTVRQMTPDERARWDEQTLATEREATPEERSRRDAALRRRARIRDMRRTRPDDAPED